MGDLSKRRRRSGEVLKQGRAAVPHQPHKRARKREKLSTHSCDFCTHVKHGTVVVDGKRVTTGPVGCKLHKDKEHQDIAATCGYCDDFHCFQSLVSVDREMQEGDGE